MLILGIFLSQIETGFVTVRTYSFFKKMEQVSAPT